ncbi:MAG: helix-turn-helix transcriptional regulator [Lachnospiraceae bacterium]|nr:helix-turn-helix transcriptional regulator [Lachnospiraceae bacterium]
MNAEYEKRVGNRIRTIREASGMTQEQLSARLQVEGCDITRSALAKMEVGQRHIYLDEIKLLKEIFQVSFDELFL